MDTLHVLNKSIAAGIAVESCCKAIHKGDSLILIEDGVYNATGVIHPMLAKVLDANTPVYAREADIVTRGLNDRIISEVQLVSDSDWVELCVASAPIVSWY